jgi:hypothetical protein
MSFAITVLLSISVFVWPAHSLTAEKATAIDPDKIPVAKDGKFDKNMAEIDKKPAAKKPVSLSKKDKAATVRRVRTLAGVQKKNLPDAPPALISLSPDNLTQGRSWLGMLKGAIRPKKNEEDVSYMTIGPHDGVYLLHFEPMSKGSPYLLDCEVAAYPEGEMVWEVHGAFNGVLEEQNGHLLVGFIATDTISTLSISRHKGVVLGHLFKCELTRVD